MSMRVRYLIIFAVSLGMTFFFPRVFDDLFLQFLFAGMITGLTWLGLPTEGGKKKNDETK